MKVIRNIGELRKWRQDCRVQGQTVGFVPTMGALHEGHGALIARSAADHPQTAVSLFVNPTQFGPNEDLAQYPRTLEADLELSKSHGATMVFVPGVLDMYPLGADTWVEVLGVGDHWCGASRPGHFRGVSTVVTKLFLLLEPDSAYFGQKDAQQSAVLSKMVTDLRFGLVMVICPTVREPDGLAMSSRNRYLNESERGQAIGLFRALEEGAFWVKRGETDSEKIEVAMRAKLADFAPQSTVEYLGFADRVTFQPQMVVATPCVVLGAVRLGKTRLIDNIVLGDPSTE
ncbi:MAG: pantoate--beta-alanine ligase [Gemmataceae bacterium]